MDHPPRGQTPLRSSPFQARALYFLKKFAIRGREGAMKSKDTVSPVAIPTRGFHHAHSSIDLLRKPELPGLIDGLRAEDGPNAMDTDDLSQDASASGNSPRLRPRRHSTWDSLRTPPIQSTFTGHGATPLLFHDSLGSQNLSNEPENLLAPAPSLLPSNSALGAVVETARFTPPTPEIPTQINASPQSKPDEQAVHDTPNNDTRRLPRDVLSHHDTFMTPLTDSVLSATSDPVTQPIPAQEETIQECPPLLPQHALPPPFCVTTERGLRLSPSIVIRQPLPLLNLPALPPPPASPCTPPRQTVPLRSVPLLPRHGRTTGQMDHEHATPGDSDEDEGDEVDDAEPTDVLSVHQSDEDEDELLSAGPSGTRGLKSSQKRPMRDGESLAESPVSPMSTQGDFVGLDRLRPQTSASIAYVAPSSNSSTTHPFSPNILSGGDAIWRHIDGNLPTPGTRLERKPSLYRVDSRSMVDLGSARRTERAVPLLKARETAKSELAPTLGPPPDTYEESEESDMEAAIGRLLRRTSMPSFHPTSDPPPYPTFNPRSRDGRVVPGDDEGRERLPPYSNSLYLTAVMPRKMEFSSPGVQAKDRKWRRVLCELEGTAFRVYKCPPGSSGAGALGDWWEKRVGVGDVACPNPPRTRKKGPGEQSEMPAKLGIDELPVPVTSPASLVRSTSVRRSESQSSMTAPSATTSTPRSAKRLSAANFLSPFRSSGSTRPEINAGEVSRPGARQLELLPVDVPQSRSSLSHESAGRATPIAQQSVQPPQTRSTARISFLPVATGRTQMHNGEIPKPPMSDLLRAYSLQHAESGLGNDYLKRRNVIRVRLEGEQFLMQAPNIPAVVEWIEGLHAGTNIALDIDQRPMPRGPMFPRRRRRRSQHVPAEDASGQRPPE